MSGHVILKGYYFSFHFHSLSGSVGWSFPTFTVQQDRAANAIQNCHPTPLTNVVNDMLHLEKLS